MKLKIKLNVIGNDYDMSHQVLINGKETFTAGSGEPEDNIIGRDVFDGDDYISLLKYGMKLSEEGYTSVEVKENNNAEWE